MSEINRKNDMTEINRKNDMTEINRKNDLTEKRNSGYIIAVILKHKCII